MVTPVEYRGPTETSILTALVCYYGGGLAESCSHPSNRWTRKGILQKFKGVVAGYGLTIHCTNRSS